MACSDCKGSGIYVGFHGKESCRKCGGSEWVGDGEDSLGLFGMKEIQKGLHPSLVCFDFPSCFGPVFETVKNDIGSMENVHWVYLLRKAETEGNWARYDRAGATEDTARVCFRMEANTMYAMYRRTDGGGSIFKLVESQ